MLKFRVKLRHDKGVIFINTHASSMEAARAIVLAAERAPDRAVLDIRAVSETGFELVPQGQHMGELVRLTCNGPAVMRDKVYPVNRSKSGYGARIATEYRVKTIDEKWRRVYCRIYSNSGTLYVMHDGIKTIVDINE